MNRFTDHNSIANENSTLHGTSSADAKIDAALRIFATAEPAPGFEQRMLARLRAKEPKARGFARFLHWSGPFAGLAGGAVACAVIIAASLSHSHRAATNLNPGMQSSGSGIGTASAMHRPAPQPLAPAPQGHGGRNQKTAGKHSVNPSQNDAAASQKPSR